MGLLDDATVSRIKDLGGIAEIAISHPHYYTSMVETGKPHNVAPHANVEVIRLLQKINANNTYTVLDSQAFGFAGNGSAGCARHAQEGQGPQNGGDHQRSATSLRWKVLCRATRSRGRSATTTRRRGSTSTRRTSFAGCTWRLAPGWSYQMNPRRRRRRASSSGGSSCQ